LIIPMIIQTILLYPSEAIWTDAASNVSRPDPSGAVQVDVEHPSRNRKVVGSNPTSGATSRPPERQWTLWSTAEPGLSPAARGAERHIQPVMGGIAGMDPALHAAQRAYGHRPDLKGSSCATPSSPSTS
jgi:hypothetical protein